MANAKRAAAATGSSRRISAWCAIAASSGAEATALRPRCDCCGWAAAPIAWPLAWPRIGSDLLHHPLLAGCPWLLPTPQRFRAAANWLELVRQGVLDGALLSGLELEVAEGVNLQELELLPLGELPLALGFCPEAPVLVGAVPEVLVPDRGVAPGLRRLLRELGLTLRSGGNSLQTPADWIGRIRGSSMALVVADREADTWDSLRRGPLASRPHSPVWLALPADWQEHRVLRHTAQELGRMGGLQQLEG
ncbi:hypothetical protein NZK32_14605 [Cyanobium sp. FGCU-52]|nr:hypothetical protein [Cyanobium sp. FGCU52]